MNANNDSNAESNQEFLIVLQIEIWELFRRLFDRFMVCDGRSID